MKRNHALMLGGAAVLTAILLSQKKTQPQQGVGSWSSFFREATNIASKPVKLAEKIALAPEKIVMHATSKIPVLNKVTANGLRLATSVIAAGNRAAQFGTNVIASGQVHTPGTEAAPSAQQGAAAVGVANGILFVEQYNGHSVWLRSADNSFIVDYTTVPSVAFAMGPFPSQAAAEQAIDAANPPAANNGMPFPDGNYQQPPTPAPASSNTLLTILGVGAAGAGAYLLAK